MLYKIRENHTQQTTLSRLSCKQRLSTWTQARYSLVEKCPVAEPTLVDQNVRTGPTSLQRWRRIVAKEQAKLEPSATRTVLCTIPASQ